MMFLHIFRQFFVRPTVYRKLNSIFLIPVFHDFIRSMSAFALLAINQWIIESRNMTRSHPYTWVHQNRAINTYIVRTLLYKLLPPCFFDIVFQLYTKWSIIPTVCKASINLRTWIDKTTICRESNDSFHCFHIILCPLSFSRRLPFLR